LIFRIQGGFGEIIFQNKSKRALFLEIKEKVWGCHGGLKTENSRLSLV